MKVAACRVPSATDDRKEVYFASGNERCHAWLYLPHSATTSKRLPIVIMAHGLGGVKKAGLSAFAERFCAVGYACLVFDYRYFGESTGEPRELLDIPSQLEDWRAAVSFARTLPVVDSERVVVWGTSFGGGHAIITAAEDPRIAAAIAQCPFTDGPSSVMAIDWKTNIKIAAYALGDIVAHRMGLAPVRVPTSGKPGEAALMTAPDAKSGLLAILQAAGIDYDAIVPARIGLQIVHHRPGRWAPKIKCPILFSVCTNDSVAPAKATLKHAARAPKGEIKLYDEGHFDIYLGNAFERNVGDQIDFLKRHVPQ